MIAARLGRAHGLSSQRMSPSSMTGTGKKRTDRAAGSRPTPRGVGRMPARCSRTSRTFGRRLAVSGGPTRGLIGSGACGGAERGRFVAVTSITAGPRRRARRRGEAACRHPRLAHRTLRGPGANGNRLRPPRARRATACSRRRPRPWRVPCPIATPATTRPRPCCACRAQRHRRARRHGAACDARRRIWRGRCSTCRRAARRHAGEGGIRLGRSTHRDRASPARCAR